MAERAKCKCGKAEMNFPNLKQEQIDGKWESECCLEAPKAEKAPEPKEEKPAEQKADKSSKKKKKDESEAK
jgi:hypothetical protein